MTALALALTLLAQSPYTTDVQLESSPITVTIPTVAVAIPEATRMPTPEDPREIRTYRGSHPFNFEVQVTVAWLSESEWQTMVDRAGNTIDVLKRLALIEAGEQGIASFDLLESLSYEGIAAERFIERHDLTTYVTDSFIVGPMMGRWHPIACPNENQCAERGLKVLRIRVSGTSPTRLFAGRIRAASPDLWRTYPRRTREIQDEVFERF